MERGGETIRDMLCRNNPWKNRKCERSSCLVCPTSKEGKGGECRQEGAVYRIQCLKCREESRVAEYWGETARTVYERGEEHVEGLESKWEKNSLWKHSLIYHGGELVRRDFEMRVIEGHKSPLNRQIHEGLN